MSCKNCTKLLTVLTLFVVLLLHKASPVSAQWKVINLETKANFRAVHAPKSRVCWIGGSGGTVLRTQDGGNVWDIMNVHGADSLDFRDIHAFDESTAIAMSAGMAQEGKAKIYRTENGGDSWQLVYQTTQAGVFLDGLDFWDKTQGICFGDPVDGRFFVLLTDDGGRSWQELPMAQRPAALDQEAAFAASGTSLIAVGKSQAFIVTGGGQKARVLRSEDRGRSWQASETPLPAGPTSGLFGVRFWSKKRGIAVGGNYQETADAAPNVLLTKDGGVSWKLSGATSPAGLKEAVGLYHSEFFNYGGDRRSTANHRYALVAVGPSGSGFSTDFGKTWTTISKEPFHAVSFAGPDGFAVGGKGLVATFTKIPKKRKKFTR
ncbi:WD40/YVTN/BNR-like repeat-containing protein [Arundinibacter roseus]|uniref:WD40/YVTN/BNR-like repeat-containing protein n=1 Tax=Arundinibacter roseus TaxID=2070510 RepID=UPI001E5B10FC|nr:oxidoreductase [Arundinibacter roseus]